MDELRELQRLSWLLANLINGGRIKTGDPTPMIRFTPGVADYGTWGCTLEIDFTKEGNGRGRTSQHGSVTTCLIFVRDEIRERLGDCPRY